MSYIEREAVLDRLAKVNMDPYGFTSGVQMGVDHAIQCIKEAKAADVAPVRHGRWERRNMGLWDEDYAYVCSVCGEVWNLIDSTPEDNNMNYCPNCGALMDGKEDEDGQDPIKRSASDH